MLKSTLSLGDYYKHFFSLYGVISSVALSPLVSIIYPNPYVFPPLGGESIEKVTILATVIFALAITFAVYFAQDAFLTKSKVWRVIVLFALITGAVISLGLYVKYHTIFVRDVNIPSKNQIITVSVGNVRNPNASLKYERMSDEDMLRDRGVTEDSVRLLFTLKSVLFGRRHLYFSYVLTVLLLTAFGSFGVLFCALDDCKERKKTA
jgi:hypothetical protein